MKYVMLIYQDEEAAKAASEAVMMDSVERFNAFTAQVRESGHMLDGHRLQHSDTATSVRLRERKLLITDGPYAETKEQLAGFYLIECTDLDEAIEIAARIPTAESGAIEIRPLFIWNED